MEAIEELGASGGEKSVNIEPVVEEDEDVGKMLARLSKKLDIIRGFESEPHRSRTCNLLIKRHEPYLISGTDYTHPVSDIRKYGRDLCFAFYLWLSSVVKLIGKTLAKILRLRIPDS